MRLAKCQEGRAEGVKKREAVGRDAIIGSFLADIYERGWGSVSDP